MSETPIEDFIREAAVWVEKDGQTYFEMVMNTVHELERRFAAERRRAEAYKKAKEENDERFQIELVKCRSRLQEAEAMVERRNSLSIHEFNLLVQKLSKEKAELEKEVERLKIYAKYPFGCDNAEHFADKIKELEARLAEREKAEEFLACNGCGGTGGHHEGCPGHRPHAELRAKVEELEASLDKHKAAIATAFPWVERCPSDGLDAQKAECLKQMNELFASLEAEEGRGDGNKK